MADSNSYVLNAATWIPATDWGRAKSAVRRRYLRRVGEIAATEKRRQVREGRGANGRPLKPVKRKSRPDGAVGKPLDPHYAASRSIRWIRTSIGETGGTVTLWWSHGWGRILGYHREGAKLRRRGKFVGRLPKRNIIDFPQASLGRIRRAATGFWDEITRKPLPPPKPVPPKPVPAPQPIAASPRGKPPKVVYLPPGQTPPRRGRAVYVYTE